MNVTVFSPHYDDAPLSLGQSLLTGELSNHSVRVINVFGLSNWTIWFHPTKWRTVLATPVRLGEELRAARAFGFTPRAARFREAVLEFGSASVDDIINEHSEPQDDPRYAALLSYVRKTGVSCDVALFPLGIGNHVDHRLLSHCASALDTANVVVGYYEDRPYASLIEDDEIVEQVKNRLAAYKRVVCSPIISETMHNKLRYPSQFDQLFIDAMNQDARLKRREHLWLPTGCAWLADAP